MSTNTNITQTDIASPPSIYEAYLYIYYNLKNNKKYVGIHKGAVSDAYKHSSTNKEFQEVFISKESELGFSVLSYGAFNEMKNKEHNILSKEDARNNPSFYNKTNGYPAYKEPDLEKCLELEKRIGSGEFNVGKEPIKDHLEMSYIQVRFQHIPELQQVVKGKVDDADGNTDKCQPVLVWEKRGANGEDKRGDGNHTVYGVGASKHAIDIPVDRVPYEVHCNFSDEEIVAIGNLRNPIPDVVKFSVDTPTGVKHCLDNYDIGVPVDSDNTKKWLKAYGFTTTQRKTIINKAKSIIDKNVLLSNNLLFINYKADPHSKSLKTTTELFGQNKGMCSIYMSSAKFDIGRIIETLYFANENLGKETIKVVIHHPSPQAETNWKTLAQPNFIKIFKAMLKDKLKVEFYEMPSTMSDGTKD